MSTSHSRVGGGDCNQDEGPQGAQGAKGPQGFQGTQGTQGATGTAPAGLSEYAFFYRDDDATFADATDMEWLNELAKTAGIVHAPLSQAVQVVRQGTYEIEYSVTAEARQRWQLIFFQPSGTTLMRPYGVGPSPNPGADEGLQVNGHVIITLEALTIIVLRNVTGAPVTLFSAAGRASGTPEPAVTGSFSIKKLDA